MHAPELRDELVPARKLRDTLIAAGARGGASGGAREAAGAGAGGSAHGDARGGAGGNGGVVENEHNEQRRQADVERVGAHSLERDRRAAEEHAERETGSPYLMRARRALIERRALQRQGELAQLDAERIELVKPEAERRAAEEHAERETGSEQERRALHRQGELDPRVRELERRRANLQVLLLLRDPSSRSLTT